jgi:stage V sporulation protein AE
VIIKKINLLQNYCVNRKMNNLLFYEKGGIGMLPMFFWAFVVGGLICVVGQLMFDVAKLTPAHTLTILVMAGAVLDGFGLYEPLIDFAGAGATIPITSFGNSLVHGAMQEADQHGLVGVLTGMFEVTSSGISAAIIFGVIGSLVFKPKG